LKLGRMTDWQETAGGPVLGVGCVSSRSMAEPSVLLEWRELHMD